MNNQEHLGASEQRIEQYLENSKYSEQIEKWCLEDIRYRPEKDLSLGLLDCNLRGRSNVRLIGDELMFFRIFQELARHFSTEYQGQVLEKLQEILNFLKEKSSGQKM